MSPWISTNNGENCNWIAKLLIEIWRFYWKILNIEAWENNKIHKKLWLTNYVFDHDFWMEAPIDVKQRAERRHFFLWFKFQVDIFCEVFPLRLIGSVVFSAALNWLHVSDCRNFLEHWKMVFFDWITLNQTIVSVTEMFSKMASTICLSITVTIT